MNAAQDAEERLKEATRDARAAIKDLKIERRLAVEDIEARIDRAVKAEVELLTLIAVTRDKMNQIIDNNVMELMKPILDQVRKDLQEVTREIDNLAHREVMSIINRLNAAARECES